MWTCGMETPSCSSTASWRFSIYNLLDNQFKWHIRRIAKIILGVASVVARVGNVEGTSEALWNALYCCLKREDKNYPLTIMLEHRSWHRVRPRRTCKCDRIILAEDKFLHFATSRCAIDIRSVCNNRGLNVMNVDHSRVCWWALRYCEKGLLE